MGELVLHDIKLMEQYNKCRVKHKELSDVVTKINNNNKQEVKK